MGIFKKKTEADRLRKKYEQLTKKAFELSRVDRKLSDQKYAEAEEIMQRISELEA